MGLSVAQFSPEVDCWLFSCGLGALGHCLNERNCFCTEWYAVQVSCPAGVLHTLFSTFGYGLLSSPFSELLGLLDAKCDGLHHYSITSEASARHASSSSYVRDLASCRCSCLCFGPKVIPATATSHTCNCALIFGCITSFAPVVAMPLPRKPSALAGAPKTCIGGSGTSALLGLDCNFAYSLLDALGMLVCPFYITLLLLFLVALWRSLVRAIPGGPSPLRRFASIPSATVPSQVLLVCHKLGSPSDIPSHGVCPKATGGRKPRARGTAFSSGYFGFCHCLLACFSLPIQVWAAPKPWSEAVNVLIAAARMMPEPLPDPPPSNGGPYDLDFQLRLSQVASAHSCVLSAPLDNSEDLPVPPLNDEEEEAEDNSSFVTGIFYVLAPHYQSEIVQMALRMPSDLQTILTQARRGLNSLRMRFSFRVVPTFPHLGSDYASVLVVPIWLEATSMQVIVWDFRGLGGPVYAAYCWNGMTYGDCVRESRRHGFHRWHVYVNGHSQALASDATFVAVPGGVIQFQPEGHGPVWRGTLPDRIERPNSWNDDPDLPEIQVDRPLLVLHHDQTTLYSSGRFPVPSAREFLTGLVERTPDTALIVAPPGNSLTNVDYYGVTCRDVLGIYPLTPSSDRESILVFLDPRQTGNPLAHIFLPERRVAPVELVRFLSLRPPVCHKIAFWPRPEEDGRLLLSEGDTVVFGYIDEATCSDESSDTLSDSSDNPDDSDMGSDRGQREQADNPGSPFPAQRSASSSDVNPHGGVRSRSPSRRSRGHSVSHEPQVPMIFTASAGLLFCACPTAASPIDASCPGTPVPLEALLRHAWWPLLQGLLALLVTLGHGILLWFRYQPLRAPALTLANVCRLLVEPVGRNAEEQRCIDTLRSLTASLGGPWLPRLPFFGLGPAAPEELALPDPGDAEMAQPRPVCCAIFKHDYLPERVTVVVPLPATEDELVSALLSARTPDMRELFPILSPIVPQHGAGNALFYARPLWGPGFLSVCLDTSAFDGRIFMGYVANYATKSDLIRKANLPPNVGPDVWVGFDTESLVDGILVHMVSGLLIRFTPAGERPPELCSLGLLLLQPDRWSSTPAFPIPSVEGAYCLVKDDSCTLFLADTRFPAHLHQQLSAATGIDQANMRIFAAQPCPSDVMLDGVLCKAVLAVGEQRDHLCMRPWRLVLLDCRPMESGWQACMALDGRLNLDSLLEAFCEEAPLGWCARIISQPQQTGFLQTVPGQTLVLCFAPGSLTLMRGGMPSQEGPAGDSGWVDSGSSSGVQRQVASNASSSSSAFAPGAGSAHVDIQGSLATTTGHRPTAMHFLLLTQGYSPELVSLYVDPPASVDEVRTLIDGQREAHGRSRFPHLIFAPVQPSMSFACVLAMPVWTAQAVPILIMCYASPVRVLSVLAMPSLTVQDVLGLAGVHSTDVHVYLLDIPWALLGDARIDVRSGDLITICPVGHPRIPPLSLERMLAAAEGWHSEPQLPGPYDRLAWVLVNQACHRIALSAHGGPSLRDLFALRVSAAPDDHVVLPAVPAIRDHVHQGIPSSQVFVASRPSGVDVVYIVDMRPILFDMVFASARGGRVDVAELCRGYRIRCPHGFCIRLYGGSSPPGAANHVRFVHPGQVLTLEFHPARSSAGQGPQVFRPPSDDDGSGSDDPDSNVEGGDPSEPTPAAIGSSGSGDAGTGSTAAPSTGGSLARTFCLWGGLLSRLVDMWNSSHVDHAISDGSCWATSVALPNQWGFNPASDVFALRTFRGWFAVCAFPQVAADARSRVVMWFTGRCQEALVVGSQWLTPVLLLCILTGFMQSAVCPFKGVVQPPLRAATLSVSCVDLCAFLITWACRPVRSAALAIVSVAAGFTYVLGAVVVFCLRRSRCPLLMGLLLLLLIVPAGAVRLDDVQIRCSREGDEQSVRTFMQTLPRPLAPSRSRLWPGSVEPAQAVRDLSLGPLPTVGSSCDDMPVAGDELCTLLEESVWHPASEAFYMACTLMETLEEHFHGSASRGGSVRSPASPLGSGSGRVVVCLAKELCDRYSPATHFDGAFSSVEEPKGSGVSSGFLSDVPQPAGPQVFDLTRQRCLLPGDPLVVQRFFARTNFASLLGAPTGLDKPHRFRAWLDAGTVGRSPSPAEVLVLTSNGSFRADNSAAGWGLVVSIRGSDDASGQFVGCLYGSLAPFLCFLGGSQTPDAYDAEVAGLVWCAAVLAQLPVSGRVVVRADNISALWGVEGTPQMRASPLCLAARSLHAAIGVASSGRVCYEHVRGHSGEPANELADALAVLGATGQASMSPFRLPISDFLRDDALVARWLPHFAMSLKRAPELPCLETGAFSWTCEPGSPVHPPAFSMRPFLRAFPSADSDASVSEFGAWLELRMTTYNALSLMDGAKERSAGLHGLAGRPTLLQQSLIAAGVHIAGLQECRTPAGTLRCGQYTRFSSGCDANSCFGNELWVCADGPCDPSSVVVLHSTPTVLIAHARVGMHKVHILVGHAPHRGHTLEVRREWWSNVAHLCHSYPRNVPWIFLLDGNCRLGSRETSAVGCHQADEEDDAGALLNDLLLGLDMCVPSTFASCMLGEGGTLFQKRSGTLDRSDYVCIPHVWLQGGCHAWVDPSIAVGHACIDHLAAVLLCSLPPSGGNAPRSRAVRLDAQALTAPANRAKVEQIILDAPRPAWGTEVSEHAAEVVDYLYNALCEQFPLPKRRLRASFFSEETTALHQAVAALRHAVRTRTQALRHTYFRCVLQAFRGPDVDFTSLFSGSWLWDLRVRLGHNCMLLRRFGRRLRFTCKADKAAHLSSLSDEVAQAPYAEVHRAVHRVLRPRKYRKSSCAPLPKLLKADGSLCQTAEEMADTWREHFRILEGGITVTAADLVTRCRSSQTAADRPDILDAACMPSWLSLEASFRHSAPRKASGPDLLSPSICRAFSVPLTELFWPLLLKSICYASEPAGLKGGVLFHIDKGKPGARSECAAHRGILAQSCLSKVFHRSLRGLVVDHWCKNSMPLQVGGKSGCSAAFGHLCSRSVLSFAKSTGMSAGLLFVDLQSAYYAVIRETVLGGGLSDRPIGVIADALGLDADDLQILKYYVEEEPILHQQHASPLLLSMARELHRQTWFVLSEDSRAAIVETQRGTRPGGTLADVLFNVLFAKVLARRRQSASSSFSPQVPWNGVRTPFPDEAMPCDQTIQVTDIAYADDLCTPVVCSAAGALRGAVSCMTADTMDVLTPHALRPNLGPTKTAAVFAPLGQGSRQSRREAFVQLKGRVPIWPESKGLLWLDLVPRYRHLGSLVSHDGKMGPEIRHRLALAASAFKEGKRKLFACKAIPLQKRALLFRTHVLSVLLSGAGTWPLLAKGEWQTFKGGILGLYRQLLCLRATGDWHHTEAQLYSQVGLPSAEALLNAERLRLLCQLVRNAPDHIWALVAWNRPLQDGLSVACDWLYSQVGSTVSLGPVAANWLEWSSYIQSRPGHWKGLIRRAEASDVERQHLRARVDRTIREAWAPAAPLPLSPLAEMDQACLLCGLAFSTQQQWGAHAQRKHGYRNSATRLAIGRQCLSCGTLYASQARLKTHLLASASCRHYLETLPRDSAVVNGKDEGHSQAPPVCTAGSKPAREEGIDLCHDLLAALGKIEVADDQEIYDLVASFVAPLPVLRRTLQLWIASLFPGALLSSAEDVLLVLKPDLLCSRVCGRVPECPVGRDFEPCIAQPAHCPLSLSGPVFYTGVCDAGWLAHWQLSLLPTTQLDLVALDSLPAKCSGLCISLPTPPQHADSFLSPGPLPLRILRLVSSWTSGFLASLPHALRVASQGIPVLLRVPVRSEQLMPISTWLTRTAAEFEGGHAFNCFTVEFIAKGTSL